MSIATINFKSLFGHSKFSSSCQTYFLNLQLHLTFSHSAAGCLQQKMILSQDGKLCSAGDSTHLINRYTRQEAVRDQSRTGEHSARGCQRPEQDRGTLGKRLSETRAGQGNTRQEAVRDQSRTGEHSARGCQRPEQGRGTLGKRLSEIRAGQGNTRQEAVRDQSRTGEHSARAGQGNTRQEAVRDQSRTGEHLARGRWYNLSCQPRRWGWGFPSHPISWPMWPPSGPVIAGMTYLPKQQIAAPLPPFQHEPLTQPVTSQSAETICKYTHIADH